MSSKIKSVRNVEKMDTFAIPECGFVWDDAPKPEETVSSSSDDEEEVKEHVNLKKKSTSTEKKAYEREKEKQIREKERILTINQKPLSLDQFDRLVLSNPNSSLIWIQYMAFHLQSGEIQKARSVARQAIQTINFKEEFEKLNIWYALLNLELHFGTTESLNKVLQEAIELNNPEKIYTHLLALYTELQRLPEIESIVNIIIGKYGKGNIELLTTCITSFFKVGMLDKARNLMQKALSNKTLPKNKHVELLLKLAQLENKYGEQNRSQTLFEEILTCYPKRVDICSVYVDVLIKSNRINIARKVLDKAITQDIPVRKMKVIFKKYIKFEEEYGSPERVQQIQQAAANYIQEECKKLNK